MLQVSTTFNILLMVLLPTVEVVLLDLRDKQHYLKHQKRLPKTGSLFYLLLVPCKNSTSLSTFRHAISSLEKLMSTQRQFGLCCMDTANLRNTSLQNLMH